MQNRIKQISEELTAFIQERELELIDVIKDVPSIISVLETGFKQLKEVVSQYEFPTPEEEIHFFKETKPQLFSKLIYYHKIYQLELNRPIANYLTLKAYLNKELEQIHSFCNKNAEFIQYYRSGKTILDKYYFLRERNEIELNLESFYFERDPKFSTHFDFKIAKLLANDMLAAYLTCKLAELKHKEEHGEYIPNIQSNERWTDKKAALVELIYALHSAESINAGDIDLKVLAAIFGKIFNVDLSDLYRIYLEIRSRKGDRTLYLKRLTDALNRRMDDADSK